MKLCCWLLTCLCVFHSLVLKVYLAHSVSKDTSHFLPPALISGHLKLSIVVLKLLHQRRFTNRRLTLYVCFPV